MKSRGYTLLELLVVIALVAIAAGMAAPMVGHLVKGDVVMAADKGFTDSLELARNSAAHRGAGVGVYPRDGDWKNGWCVRLVDGVAGCDASDNVLSTFEMVLDSATITSSENAVVYNSGGTRFGGGGVPAAVTWKICADKCREVTVLGSGAYSSKEIVP